MTPTVLTSVSSGPVQAPDMRSAGPGVVAFWTFEQRTLPGWAKKQRSPFCFRILTMKMICLWFSSLSLHVSCLFPSPFHIRNNFRRLEMELKKLKFKVGCFGKHSHLWNTLNIIFLWAVVPICFVLFSLDYAEIGVLRLLVPWALLWRQGAGWTAHLPMTWNSSPPGAAHGSR